ncbi:hypothetical protein GCM10007415_15510 [Parapedobacter pyrenivorans]|uniref:CHAT domain-containing protein n=1 Tax=Parapedobacter pyrenivorans TaxID=1305674 RepID=A0A917M741_9SPHI|nr:CHAT domain-containing protein [Parapedobacter pyrenivorans]GGG83338.1 hypothetical protein GCM10007415_15510 [Parapedobacter pyrenivorans]
MAALVKTALGCFALWVGLLMGCRDTKRDTLQAPHAADVAVDTLVLLRQLEQLGNIAYDHPERFVHNPDSFIKLLAAEPTTAEGKEMYAWLLLNIGYALRENGNILASVRYYELAMDYCITSRLDDPDFVLYIAKPLGNLYTQIGDLQKALHIHQRAIDLSKARQNLQYLPALYGNMAITYQQIGWPDSLRAACTHGLLYVRENDIHAALLYNTLARSHQEVDQLDSAAYYNELALSLFSGRPLQGDTLIWYTAALHQQSFLAGERRQLPKALQAINQALALAETHLPNGKQREKAKYYYTRGNLHFLCQRPFDAIQDFQKTLFLFSPDPRSPHSFPDYTFTEALWGLARTHALQQSDSAAHYYVKAIENAYYSQQLIASSASHYQNSAWNRKLLHEAMAHLWQRYERTSDYTTSQSLAMLMLWITELSKGRQLHQEINRSNQWAQDSVSSVRQRQRQRLQYLLQAQTMAGNPQEKLRLQQEVEQLAFELQLAENHFDQSFAPPDFDAFTTSITARSDSATLVSYFIDSGGGAYYTATVRGQSVANHIPAASLSDLPHFMETYFGYSPTAYDNDPLKYQTTASAIANLLLPTAGGATCRMIVSPDGPLFTLPFDALVKDGHFLGERNTINYTYTFLLNMQEHSPSPRHTSIAVLAKQDYQGTGLRDLHFVSHEAAYLATHFNADTYLDDAATDSVFFEALANGQFIHVAAHAIADGVGGPYLVLDHPVTLDKLQYIHTSSPLIFLSACQTASGQLLPGEGVESLNKTFLSKGIHSVIASYWTVDDQTTAALAQLFYDALAETGQPAQALAIAKRRYLATSPPLLQNPWYWASLQLTGIDSPIYLEPRRAWAIWSYWTLGIVAFGALLWWLVRAPKRRLQCKNDKTY